VSEFSGERQINPVMHWVGQRSTWVLTLLIVICAAAMALVLDQIILAILVSSVGPDDNLELYNIAATAVIVALPLSAFMSFLVKSLHDSSRDLISSEKRLKEFVATSSDWFWETDEDHRFIKLFGSANLSPLPETIIVGNFRWSNATLKDLENVEKWERHKAILKVREPFRNFDFEVNSDPPIWIRVSGNPVFREDGTFSGYLGTATDHTEERLKGQKLREQDERLRIAVSAMTSGFALWDASDNLVVCNEQFRDLYPAIRSRIIPGANFGDLTRAAANSGDITAMEGNLKDWADKNAERHSKSGSRIVYQLANGRWIQAIERRTFNGGSISERTDITDLILANQALTASEVRFSTAFKANPQICTITTLEDGRYIDVNHAFETVTGYSREETIGATTADLNIWPDPDFRKRFVDEISKFGRVENMDTRFCKKNGAYRETRISAERITLDGQECILGVFPDVTDEIIAANALKESERNLKSIIHTASAPIVVVNSRGQILEWNVAAAKITGYAEDEVHYCIFTSEFVPEEFSHEAQNQFRLALSGLTPESFEIPVRTKDGGSAAILFSLAPQLDHSGKVIGAVAIGQDVTALKQAQDQLSHAQKLESVGYLSGGIAHDFNNLLQTISGAAVMIDSLKDTPELQDEWVSRIESSIERGGLLTSQLLTFSRQQSLDPRTVHPSKAL
jgi:PAS domain S-box-containing protein